MGRLLSLTIEFFTNIQIIAITNNEAIIEAITEFKTVVTVVLVRLAFLLVEKYGIDFIKKLKFWRK